MVPPLIIASSHLGFLRLAGWERADVTSVVEVRQGGGGRGSFPRRGFGRGFAWCPDSHPWSGCWAPMHETAAAQRVTLKSHFPLKPLLCE